MEARNGGAFHTGRSRFAHKGSAGISLPSVKVTVTTSVEQTAPSQHFPVTDDAVIREKNLFHPERKIPPEQQPEKVTPKPDAFLYGTLIADDASYAFIEDKKAPYSTPGRGKRQTILKKGDHLTIPRAAPFSARAASPPGSGMGPPRVTTTQPARNGRDSQGT